MVLCVSWSLVLAITAAFIYFFHKKHKFRNFPPGPSLCVPILGHLPILGNEPYKTMMDWKKKHGPLIGLQLGNYRAVFLNDLKTFREVLNQKECGGRAQLELFEKACRGKGVAFNDGPIQQEQRQFVVKQLRDFSHSNNVLENSIQEEIEEVLSVFKNQEEKPLKMKDFFHVSILNGTWSLFMGQRFNRSDKRLKKFADAIHEFCTIDGALVQLAMFLPFISKYFPEFSGFKKQLDGFLTNYNFMEENYNKPLPPGHIQGQPRNFKEAWIDQVEKVGDDTSSSFHPSQNCYPVTTGDVFMSSMESVSTTIEWAMLYFSVFPEIQKKLQEEIDEQIGTTRIPLLMDRPRMPYMDAVFYELLRFSTIVPMNGPWRRATEDFVYNGYVIPKNTFIVGNTYAIHNDPDIWGDPENFRPERFLNSEGRLDRTMASNVVAFSTGKRSCIGENLARDEIFLYLTSILQKFHVRCTKENPSLVGSPGMVRYPEAFEIVFSERFKN